MSGENPREIAARVLGQREGGGAFVEDLLENALASAPLAPPDRRLCQELVYGIVRWQQTLDWLIARKTQNRTQKRPLQHLLQLGLYQIFWLDRIPDHAAVHQTVELARQSGFGPQSGFVNAVLRGYLREAEPTRKLLEDLKSTQPHLGFSHPEWLVKRWRARWGAANAARLMAWNNTPPKTYARVNLLKADPGKLVEQWRDENVDYDFVRGDWFEENLVFELKSHPSLAQLPSFQQGLFYIQDPSTLLAVRELDPQPGQSILDFCAAPGGKLTYIAQLIRNEGDLVGQELDPGRRKFIEENCARLGVTCATTSGPMGPGTSKLFDRILVDAPCSNTGVMRRRVDLRWRLAPAEMDRLAAIQSRLLAEVSTFLKPGGVLVYSTCSLESEENEEVIQEFTRTHPGWNSSGHRVLAPFSDGFDGAFTARLSPGAPGA